MVSALGIGCDDKADEAPSSPAEMAGGGMMAPEVPESFESTFAALQYHLFENQGCTEAACHGSAAAGDLTLTADVSYGQLVEAASTGSSMPRVEPGDRSRSYLYLKLLAALEPDTTEVAGGPMPTGREPIPRELLNALRLWIYAGAPETGAVEGTAALLDTELPPVGPITIAPLPPPDPAAGFQLEMPPWPLEANTEREVCFASYFDVSDQVPAEFKDEAGEFAYVRAEQLRQDPHSHHLILNYSTVDIADIHDPSYGGWTCHGGEMPGTECEPTDLTSCGAGHCATAAVDGFACIGYGPRRPPANASRGSPSAGPKRPKTTRRSPMGCIAGCPSRGSSCGTPTPSI